MAIDRVRHPAIQIAGHTAFRCGGHQQQPVLQLDRRSVGAVPTGDISCRRNDLRVPRNCPGHEQTISRFVPQVRGEIFEGMAGEENADFLWNGHKRGGGWPENRERCGESLIETAIKI
jgi:hypothetical protein